LQQLQNDFLKRQVDELKGLLGEVKNAFQKFPMPAKEPERMLVMNDGGFMNMKDTDAAASTLRDIAREGVLKMNCLVTFNMIGDFKQYSAAAYVPVDDSGDGNVIDISGMTCPRKMSTCQHVVAHEKALTFEGLQNAPAGGPVGVEDLQAVSKVDTEVAKMLENMQASGGQFDVFTGASKEGRSEEEEANMKNMGAKMFESFFAQPDKFFYSGVPIVVDGQVMGSFCIVSPTKPANFDPDYMEAQAKKAAAALELQLEINRKNEAQQVEPQPQP